MLKERLIQRSALVLILFATAWGLSACYKDAGENVQPTSNRVDLNDIMPTNTIPPTPMFTSTPISQVTVELTRTLVPTTTPQGDGASLLAETPIPVVTQALGASPQFAPSFTPVIPVATSAAAGIETPGMSDILPSNTPAPTLNPALQPTPTSIPVELNPCIHVVKSGDTLYSIARDNEVEVNDLVAANPSYFGGNSNTILQIGWQLQLPGCGTPEPDVTATIAGVEAPAGPAVTVEVPTSGNVTHVVESGDTLYSIARQYGVDPQAIISANPGINPNMIHPGDTIIVPLGE
ncbi:MAG: LysM peptidoglycan-binding domain-containing protein [Chloroflexi bacterium]|nr:LysM peptidoglycan-binding domain-containing protein [Chloroflexota bacterium]